MMQELGQLTPHLGDVVLEVVEVPDQSLNHIGKATGGELVEVPLLNDSCVAFAVEAKSAL